MKLYLIILFVCILELKGAKLNNKKTLKTKANTQSAIIAIQIIDPHENKTSTKNSKRTIDSSLGYGYQSIFGGKQPPPRYETYKYSQHDIPPYNGSPPAQFNGGIQSQSYEIQPSVSKQIYNTDVSNHYQPGTVLFSTIDQRGQLGDLSSQFPVSLENHQYPIPVIILRVHPNQLTNPVYPKLPQNHLLASEINSIDINSLLSNYIKNNVKQNPEPEYQPQYQQTQTYVLPGTMNFQSADYQSADYQSQQNYPQYQYESTQQNNQNYKLEQDISNLPEPRSPGVVSNYQYSDYNRPAPIYQQPAAPVNDYGTTELLTHENYPSDKHTQVIFKRSKGKRRNVNKQRPVKTQSTKSHVPAQETQHDEISNYNTKDSNSNTYSPPLKSHVPTQNNQIQDENVNQYDGKYGVPNTYYTNQYPQDQQYVYKNAPQYAEQQVPEMYQDVQPAHETEHYVYISSQPEQHNSNI